MEYNSDPELKVFLSCLDFTSAVGVLELALEHATSQGAYSLKEAAVIAACLMALHAPEQDNNPV